MANDKVHTVEEVAKILRVSEATVRSLLERGELKGFKVGNQWRINDEDLRSYMRR